MIQDGMRPLTEGEAALFVRSRKQLKVMATAFLSVALLPAGGAVLLGLDRNIPGVAVLAALALLLALPGALSCRKRRQYARDLAGGVVRLTPGCRVEKFERWLGKGAVVKVFGIRVGRREYGLDRAVWDRITPETELELATGPRSGLLLSLRFPDGETVTLCRADE